MKETYKNRIFDSALEVEYFKYLEDNKKRFLYQDEYKHRPIKINLGRRKTYVPDFIVFDDDEKIVTIIEMKGYAKWTANEDNNIMDFMKNKVEYDKDFLISWLVSLDLDICGYDIEYQRLKHLKGIGFVDYNYKNPNSRVNVLRRNKEELEVELKELKLYKKNIERYFGYLRKYKQEKKLTKDQLQWLLKFERENNL